MQIIDNFSEEEILNMWKNSFTKKDFCLSLGYKTAGHVQEFQNKYNLSDKDLGINLPNHKKYILSPNRVKMEDLTDQIFGHWKVIEMDFEKTKNDSKNSWWICQCDCKNHTISSIAASNLKRGKTQSCGCQSTSIPIQDMIGMSFGKLTIIGINKDKKSKRGIYLKCQCSCGNIVDVISVDLRNGKTQSCGCLKSKGENLIRRILQEHNINFIQQYSFEDLKNPKTNSNLKFDFAIFLSNTDFPILIEYQGIQHYKEVEYFGSFKESQYRDNLKRQYCKNNNLILLEIPYWDFDKLSFEYLKEVYDGQLNWRN